MARVGIVKTIALATLLVVFLLGTYNFLFERKASNCDKVAINKKLRFSEIKLSSSIREKFPHYTLHYYGFHSQSLNKLNGLPILFIPGHSGSYLEVESIGSALHRVTKNLLASFHFDIFALNFGGDLSAFYGPVLMKQTEFAQECVDQILLLYGNDHQPKKNVKNNKNIIRSAINNNPDNVFVIGHSMGGMVARALFLLAEFDRSSVLSIVTLATSHRYSPITTLDWSMASFYDNVNEYWGKKLLDDLFFHSIGGGINDISVKQLFTRIDRQLQTDNTLMTMTTSSPRVWASLEHENMMECKWFVYELTRSLYDSVDKRTNQFSNSSSFRYSAFQYHFEKNAGPVYQKTNYDLMTNINKSITWQVKDKRSWKFIRPSVLKSSYLVMVISKWQAHKFGFIAITNVENHSWFGACTLGQKDTKCQQMGNFGRYANLLPPTSSNLKIVTLDGDRLDMFTHWVVLLPQSKETVLMMVEMYSMKKRLYIYNVTTLYDVITHPIESLSEPKVILNTTRPSFLFYNISLHGFTTVFQAYHISFICNSCLDNTTVMDANFSVAKMHVPWSKEHIYLNIARGENAEMVLMLSTPSMEPTMPDVYLHLYLMTKCSYKVQISIAWKHTFGQFVRFYASYLPASILIQILMALSWQLMLLDDLFYAPSFTESHINWAQPYRVGAVAFVVRFVLSYSDEDNIGKKLGLPLGDVDILERMGLWNSSVPLILYMTAYAFVFFFAWFINLLLLISSQFVTTAVLGNRDRKLKILNIMQYLLVSVGFFCSCFICGTLGIITSAIIFIIRMITSGIKTSSMNSPISPQNSRFNISFTIFLILTFSCIINITPLLQWWLHLSWEHWNLPDDPIRNSGMLVSVATMFFVYTDFPIFNNELLSVAGMISYLCCICICLYCTVHVYRLNYFIDAILMSIAMPSFLVYVSRKYRSRCLRTTMDSTVTTSTEKAML